jgi:hypothetical protein
VPTIDGYSYRVDLGTGNSGTITNVVWTNWITTTTTTISNIVYPAWDAWNTGGATPTVWRFESPTPEQVAAELQAQADRLAEEQAAAARARVILEENLTEEQRKQLADNNWFEVITPKGTYRIRRGWAGNVDRLDDGGRVRDRFCIHPSESVPPEDNMLAQKLLLEANEEMFLRIANRTPVYA